jgi:branched-chain amino acid transport system permease protein
MSYVYSIVTVVAIFSLLTLSLNLQFGQGGMINFGLVAYFAIGAFTYAILIQPPPTSLDGYVIGLELTPWLAAVLAVAASVLVALSIGRVVLRLRAEYFALAVFAFAQVVESLFVNVRELGNGVRGLSGVQPPIEPPAGEDYSMWFMVGSLVVLAIVWFLLNRLTRSPFGSTLRAIRDDEVAAGALGKEVERFRMGAFLVGAGIAGLAGVIYGSYTSHVSPELFTAEVTFIAFIALVIGGLGSNLGAVIGAAVFFGIEELLDLIPISADTAVVVSSAKIIPFGLAVILVLRFAPQGLIGSLSRRAHRQVVT